MPETTASGPRSLKPAAPATQAYVSYVEEPGLRATKQTRPNAAARSG